MKNLLLILGIASLMAACNSDKEMQQAKQMAIDSMNLATMKQRVIDSMNLVMLNSRRPTYNGTSAKRKGWTNAGKGAVIGGVAGAGVGAAVSRRNPSAGALVGGIVGAGSGALIGDGIDKKKKRR